MASKMVTFWMLLAFVFTGVGCGGRPWGLIVRASQSELRASAQAADRLLEGDLRRTLIASQPTTALRVTPHVYMERAFVIGPVGSMEEQEAIMATARTVDGLRSLEFYLPIVEPQAQPAAEPAETDEDTPAEHENVSGDERSSLDRLGTSAEIKARLLADPTVVSSRVDVEVVDGTVVLLGVVQEREQQRVVDEVVAAADGYEIENWMLEPERAYMKRVRLLR